MDTWSRRDSFCHPIKANCVKPFLHFIWKRFLFLKVWVKVYGGGGGGSAGKWRAPASRFPFQWESIEILCPVECENPFELEQTFLKTKPHARYIQNRWRYISQPLQIKFKQVKYNISDLNVATVDVIRLPSALTSANLQDTSVINMFIYSWLLLFVCSFDPLKALFGIFIIKLMSSLHGTITCTETASCFNRTAFLKSIQCLNPYAVVYLLRRRLLVTSNCH